MKLLSFVGAIAFFLLCTETTFSQGNPDPNKNDHQQRNKENSEDGGGDSGSRKTKLNKKDLYPLLVVESILLFIVLILYPLYSYSKTAEKILGVKEVAFRLRGLNLPNGSIRSMIALIIIGSFINFLVFGAPVINSENATNIITAFGTLSGSVVGFYFGSRGSTPTPPA